MLLISYFHHLYRCLCYTFVDDSINFRYIKGTVPNFRRQEFKIRDEEFERWIGKVSFARHHILPQNRIFIKLETVTWIQFMSPRSGESKHLVLCNHFLRSMLIIVSSEWSFCIFEPGAIESQKKRSVLNKKKSHDLGLSTLDPTKTDIECNSKRN